MDAVWADVVKTIVTVIGGGILALIGQAVMSYFSLKTKQLEIQGDSSPPDENVDDTDKLLDREPVLFLLGHSVFSELDNCEMFFLTRFKLADPVRTRIVVEIMVHKIRIWRAALHQLAIEMQPYLAENIDEDNRQYVRQKFCSMYNQAMIDYVSWHKLPGALSVDGLTLYDTQSIATMDIALAKFKLEHAAAETIVWVAINDIAESDTYALEDFRRCWDIFTIYMFAFVQMKLDSERTMNNLNGGLTGKPFLNGSIVGPM